MKPNERDPVLERALAKLCAESGAFHVPDPDVLAIHLAASFDVPEDVLRTLRDAWRRGETPGPADEKPKAA